MNKEALEHAAQYVSRCACDGKKAELIGLRLWPEADWPAIRAEQVRSAAAEWARSNAEDKPALLAAANARSAKLAKGEGSWGPDRQDEHVGWGMGND